MSTQRLGLGERGAIEVSPQRQVEGKWKKAPSQRSAERWRARCYYRGMDGILREASRVAATRDDAVAAVEKAFSRSLFGTSDEMDGDTPLVRAGELWLQGIARTDGGLSAKTVLDYGSVWHRCIDVPGSSIRGLTLEQANSPQRLRAFLRKVADQHGTGSAKMTRSALSGVLRLAVSNGALTTNALRQVGRVQAQNGKAPKRKSGEARDTKRAFTAEERAVVLAYADTLAAGETLNPRTRRKQQSVADVMHFLAGTGCRIAEVRNLDWADVHLAARKALIRGTKTDAAERTLDLPAWLIERMGERAERVGTEGLAFASPHHLDSANAIVWDQSNLARNLAAVFAGAGHGWASPHTFRRTVATMAHKGGEPLIDIADHLGHKDPAMTASVYLGREPHGDRSSLADLL